MNNFQITEVFTVVFSCKWISTSTGAMLKPDPNCWDWHAIKKILQARKAAITSFLAEKHVTISNDLPSPSDWAIESLAVDRKPKRSQIGKFFSA